jgi:hypothetical protein
MQEMKTNDMHHNKRDGDADWGQTTVNAWQLRINAKKATILGLKAMFWIPKRTV